MKLKNNISLIILLLTSIILTLTPSCGTSNTNNENITVQDFTERVRENIPKLNSYLVNAQITMNRNEEVEGVNTEMEFFLGGEGAVDIKAKKSSMNMSASVRFIEGENITEESSQMSNYIVDSTIYICTADEDGTMTWENQESPSTAWEEGIQTKQLITLLENSQIITLTKEIIDGQSCFLAELTPDTSLL